MNADARTDTGHRSFLATVAICGALALALGLFLPWELRLELYATIGPAVALLLWLASAALGLAWMVHWLRAAAVLDRRWFVVDISFAVVAALVLAAVVPNRALIEGDESQIALTAQRIAAEGRADSGIAGVYDAHGRMLATDIGLDKRGLGLSTAAAVVMPLVGDALSAAQTINLVLGALILFLLVRIARRHAAGAWPLLAAIGLCSTPVFALSVRGGGLDVAHLAGVLAIVHLLQSQWLAPHALRGWLLVTCMAVLAQIRTEGLVVASLALLLLYGRALSCDERRRGWALRVSALLLVPAAWRLAVPFHYELPVGTTAMGLEHLARNALGLLHTALWPGDRHLTAVWINGLALFAAAGALWRLGDANRRGLVLASVLSWLPLMVSMAMVLTFYWGQAGTLITARYFLGLYALASIAACLAVYALARKSSVAAIVVAAVLLLGSTAQLYRAHFADPFIKQPAIQQREWVLLALRQRYGDCNLLLLHPHTAIWLARGIGSMPADRYLLASAEQRANWHLHLQSVVFAEFRGPQGQSLVDQPSIDGGQVLGQWPHPAGWTLVLRALWASSQPADRCPRRPTRFGRVDPASPQPRPQWLDLRDLGPDQVMVR